MQRLVQFLKKRCVKVEYLRATTVKDLMSLGLEENVLRKVSNLCKEISNTDPSISYESVFWCVFCTALPLALCAAVPTLLGWYYGVTALGPVAGGQVAAAMATAAGGIPGAGLAAGGFYSAVQSISMGGLSCGTWIMSGAAGFVQGLRFSKNQSK